MGMHDGHREKMRRRFISGGLESFADHEALEMLLFYAIPRKNTNEIAHHLLDKYGSLTAVMSAPLEDLQKVPGIGENAAILLRLVPQLCRKARLADMGRETIFKTNEQAGNYLMEYFAGERNEVIYVLCLDRKGKLLACKRMSEGNTSNTELNIRMLIETVLLTSASEVILAHNHPSGVALPSDEDFLTTAMVQDALAPIGVKLADHIIVADGDYVSMADSGYLVR